MYNGSIAYRSQTCGSISMLSLAIHFFMQMRTLVMCLKSYNNVTLLDSLEKSTFYGKLVKYHIHNKHV